ncbi:MAG: sulfatase-like hydrolase/transferase [Armatimonadota bacterium]
MSKSGLTRRDFIKGAAVGTAAYALTQNQPSTSAAARAKSNRPNLIFMHTDQQHFQAISGLGCRELHTPNMDRLMKRGVTFADSYSANPVCCPERACWYTGRCSSENGMLSNNHTLNPDLPDLGQWFSANGYECFYSGKWHIPGRNPNTSFNCLTANTSGQGQHQDPIVAQTAQSLLQSYSGDKPFFLSLGFLQPHDCCYWAFTHKAVPDQLPFPLTDRDLPKLPKNYAHTQRQPKVVDAHFKGISNMTRGWTDMQWRLYMHDYYRMVEEVDAEIGRVLDALEDSKFASNTVVVFTADHGDGLARRKLLQKWWLYDEAVRVPMIISAPGSSEARMDRSHVVSGLDVAPTLCDYAGIPCIPKARGRSLKPLVEGHPTEWREFVVSDANITGRMVRTPEYKFIAYKDDPVVQLFDMRRDPWEMTNLADEAKHADTVASLQRALKDWESHLEVTG